MKADHGAQLKYINKIHLYKMKAVLGPLVSMLVTYILYCIICKEKKKSNHATFLSVTEPHQLPHQLISVSVYLANTQPSRRVNVT